VTLVLEKLAELTVLLLLGGVLPIGGVLDLGWPVLLAALGLIFVIRPVAVLLSLLPTKLAWQQRLFIAWFGIRGLGSVYYLGFAFAVLTPVDARPLFSVVAVAIIASVMLHGISGALLTRTLLRSNTRDGATGASDD
jgi:NhaP-type Na+/H+ or K+/H+ antiporter